MSSTSSTTTTMMRNVSTKPQMPGVTVSGSNSSSAERTSNGSAAAITSTLPRREQAGTTSIGLTFTGGFGLRRAG